MIILLAGASHTGKSYFAQKLLEKYYYPVLSIDHLKMGLIRSGYTSLTPEDDRELVAYLWPVVREMVKTAIENEQNLIVEGCYIPPDWRQDFSPDYLENITYRCLIMTPSYIRQHFSDIERYADTVEKRLDASLSTEALIADNEENLRAAIAFGNPYILIDENYPEELEL